MAELRVLTRNLYLGASLDPIIAAPDVGHIPRAVAEAWARIAASMYVERAAAIAAEIAAHTPHLVGLQEVWDFTVTSARHAAEAAPPARADYLALLLAELSRCGVEYTVASAIPGPEFTVPSATGHLIHAYDRDVILSRGDVTVLENGGARYRSAAVVRPGGEGGQAMPANRAWARARVLVNDLPVWIVSTHLETPHFRDTQLNQAVELAELTGGMEGALVAVGDFNSGPGDPHLAPYERLLAAGLADAWEAARPGEPGPTCGQAEDLRNPESRLSARIDLVLTRSEGQPCIHIDRTGHEPSCRTPSGLWPSDHAGLVAALDLDILATSHTAPKR